MYELIGFATQLVKHKLDMVQQLKAPKCEDPLPLNQSERLNRTLISWFEEFGKDYPWRTTNDPYEILVSEVMLQQTQVKTVIPFYNRWIEQFPDFESVARAHLDSLLMIWEGLGYYNRCKNFHKAVKIIVKKYNSCLPANIEDFMALPGVGIYTAAAVYSIVFLHPIPVVDGNVNRVMSRLLRLLRFTPYNKKRVLSTLIRWLDRSRPGDNFRHLGCYLTPPGRGAMTSGR